MSQNFSSYLYFSSDMFLVLYLTGTEPNAKISPTAGSSIEYVSPSLKSVIFSFFQFCHVCVSFIIFISSCVYHYQFSWFHSCYNRGRDKG